MARILESITDAFLALDLNGRFTYLNRAARQVLSELVPNPDDLIGTDFNAGLGPFVQQYAEQYRQVLVERRPIEFETYHAILDRWFEVHAYPSEDGVSVCFRDVTVRKRAEESLSLLAETSAVLARSLDYATTLSAIVRLTVPSFADHCVVFLKGHAGQVVALEAASADPRDHVSLDRVVRDFLRAPNWDDHPIARVLRTGRSDLIESISPEGLARYVRDQEHAQLVVQLHIRSVITAPLVARGQTLGAIAFARSHGARRYSPEDMALGEEIAHRCARALENARLYYQANEAEQSQRRQLEFTRAVTESIGIGVYAADREGRTTFVNQTAARWLGWEAADMVGKPAHHTIHGRRPDGTVYPPEDCPIARTRLDGSVVRSDDDTFWRRDGTPLPVAYTATPIRSEGDVVGAVVVFEDISARKRADEERTRLEAAIERERSILLATMASMSDGLVVVDQDVRVCYYNPRAAEMMRVPGDRVLGQRLDDTLTWFLAGVESPENVAVAWKTARENVWKRPVFEVTFHGPPRQHVVIQLFPVVDAQGERIGAAALLRDVTMARHLAALQERERIAMDLHDGVIQALYGLSLSLGAGEQAAGDRDQVTTLLRRAGTQIDTIIQMIRNYIFDLRMSQLGAQGLRVGLETLAEEARVNALTYVEVSVDDAVEGALDRATTVDLLQIMREATSNIIRHARASNVVVQVRRVDSVCVVTIHDNGRGFDPLGSSLPNGQGLRNMAERTRTLGGRFAIESTPGRGTTVRLEIPLGAEAGHD